MVIFSVVFHNASTTMNTKIISSTSRDCHDHHCAILSPLIATEKAWIRKYTQGWEGNVFTGFASRMLLRLTGPCALAVALTYSDSLPVKSWSLWMNSFAIVRFFRLSALHIAMTFENFHTYMSPTQNCKLRLSEKKMQTTYSALFHFYLSLQVFILSNQYWAIACFLLRFGGEKSKNFSCVLYVVSHSSEMWHLFLYLIWIKLNFNQQYLGLRWGNPGRDSQFQSASQ